MVPKDRRNLYEHGALVWLAEAWIVARRSFGEQKLYRRAGSTRYSARAACSMTVFEPCVMNGSVLMQRFSQMLRE